MKILKIIFIIFVFIFAAGQQCFAGDISINHNNGIYHIVLKGEKIKKKIKHQNRYDYL